MKTVLYFVLSILAIAYVGFMCALNINPGLIESAGAFGKFLEFVRQYGGVILVFVFAFVNFFGSPLKAVFFTILIIVAIFYIITAAAPQIFGFVKNQVNLWINF